MKPLTVLILAGGGGTRFRPFNEDKLLWSFANKTLFERIVLTAIPKNAERIVIVTNKRNTAIVKKYTYPVPPVFVEQKEPLGMADAILSAEEHIADSSLLLFIADDYVDPSLPTQIIETAGKTNAFGVVPGWHANTYFPGGYLVLHDTQIVDIIEKPGEGREPSSFVALSGHFIRDSSTLVHEIKQTATDKDDRYEKALSQLMKKELFLFHPYEGEFISLKYPWHVLSFMDLILKDIKEFKGSDVVIKPHVVIEGPVHIGNNVKIQEFTKITGPAYIGDNTIIGNANVIRYSMIGNNCVTGFSTDITRSYIGNNCWFHTNYIGDSVLEENISMGSGTVLANLRLDEQQIRSIVKEQPVNTKRNKLGAMIGSNVRIGVNTSIMPGTKIGSNSCIGAGLVIDKDIPEQSFVKGISEFSIRTNTASIVSDRDQFKKKL